MYEEKREHMVNHHLKRRDITDKNVLEAMKEVERHEFIPEKRRDLAYGDFAIPLKDGLTISQPYIVAKMLQLLQLQPTDKLLEIGSGSGYALAVASKIVDKAIGIELDEDLIKQSKETHKKLGITNTKIVKGDGSKGLISHHPYTKILISAATPKIPEILMQQLKPNGIIVAPIGDRMNQKITKIIKKDKAKEEHDSCRFVPLKGKHGF